MTDEQEGDTEKSVEDRFYQGVVLKLFPGRRTGVIRTGNGREVPFSSSTVELIGDSPDFDLLYEGMPVGFDLTRTSEGLRVTRIKVYGRG